MRSYIRFKRSKHFALAAGLVILTIISMAGCTRVHARPLIDRAFALVYPELSARIIKEFKNPASEPGQSSLDIYLPLPPGSSPPNINSEEIYIASPAIAASLKAQAQQTSVSVINLLSEASAFPSITWDSTWAYRQMGLIAGYRTAALRKTAIPDATASILFSRGVGRTESVLSAFESAFAEGARAAGFQESGIRNGDEQGMSSSGSNPNPILNVFDIDSIGLHGDRLEQTLATCAQMLQKNPSVIIIAAGSLGALQKALDTPGDVIADLRGLGQHISKKKLFAAMEENVAGLVHAAERVVRAMREKKPMPNLTLVPPSLYLSGEARRTLKAAER